MSRLHFNRADVQRLLDHARAATMHRSSFGQDPNPPPALWLVGDGGVYLMSNGFPHLPKEGAPEEHSFVVYADEVNPEKMSHDDCWNAKGRIFGRDDGVEILELSLIDKALKDHPADAPFILDLTRGRIAFVTYEKTKPSKNTTRKQK